MFRTIIWIVQLLTVAATQGENAPYETVKENFSDDYREMSNKMLIGAWYKKTFDDRNLKKYVDESLKPALTKFNMNVGLFKPKETNYNRIGKLLEKHVDGIAMFYRLQKFGNGKLQNIVEYDIAIELAYYFYLFKALIECNALPLEDGKRISFDALYEYTIQFVPDIETDADSKALVGALEDSLKLICSLIDKYWDEDLIKLRKISAKAVDNIDKATKESADAISERFDNALKKLYNAEKLNPAEYFKIESFHHVLSAIGSFLEMYIKGVAILRSDYIYPENKFPVSAPIYGFSRIVTHIDRIGTLFVRRLYMLVLGPYNIKTFFTELDIPCNEAMVENPTPGSDIGNDLLDMLIANQSLGIDITKIEMTISRENGCALKISDDAVKTFLDSLLKHGSGNTGDDEDDEETSEWIKWVFLIGCIIILVIFISAYVYSKYS